MKLDSTKLKEIFVNFLVPIIAIGGVVGLFLLIILPSIGDLPILKQEYESANTLRNQLQSKLEALNEFEAVESAVNENSELVSKALASEADVPELLTQIDTIAKESGLSVVKLSYSFAEGPSTLQQQEEAADYSKVLVTLGVEGNYAQMVAFLDNLENSARVVTVDRYRYSRGNDEDSTTIGVTFSLSSPYLFVDSQAVTDEPILIDITDQSFIDFMSVLKDLRFYEPVIDASLIIEETEEESDETQEESQGDDQEDDEGLTDEQIQQVINQTIQNDTPASGDNNN